MPSSIGAVGSPGWEPACLGSLRSGVPGERLRRHIDGARKAEGRTAESVLDSCLGRLMGARGDLTVRVGRRPGSTMPCSQGCAGRAAGRSALRASWRNGRSCSGGCPRGWG